MFSSQTENPKVYDIALIRLSSTVPIGPDIAKRISPVLLPGGRLTKAWPPDGAACVIVGWGCTKEGWYPSGYWTLDDGPGLTKPGGRR